MFYIKCYWNISVSKPHSIFIFKMTVTRRKFTLYRWHQVKVQACCDGIIFQVVVWKGAGFQTSKSERDIWSRSHCRLPDIKSQCMVNAAPTFLSYCVLAHSLQLNIYTHAICVHKRSGKKKGGGGQPCLCTKNSIKQTAGCLKKPASFQLNMPSKQSPTLPFKLPSQPLHAIQPLPQHYHDPLRALLPGSHSCTFFPSAPLAIQWDRNLYSHEPKIMSHVTEKVWKLKQS